MKKIILADNQDLTQAGWQQILTNFQELELLCSVKTRLELLPKLKSEKDIIVILDYVLFDFEDVQNLVMLENNFTDVQWIICSDDLNDSFYKYIILNTRNVSVFTKSSSCDEISSGLKEVIKGNRYICNLVSNSLLDNSLLNNKVASKVSLTTTEKQILIDIATGKTTKDIAMKRFISVHTVMTHRKNIFKKIDVNNIHEATKFALRAGLIDMTEYYI